MATIRNPGQGSNPSSIGCIEVDLTHADIIALKATPIVITEVPGDNRGFVPLYASFVVDTVSAAYTGGGAIKIGTTNNLIKCEPLEDALEAQALTQQIVFVGPGTPGIDSPATVDANLPIKILNDAGGEWASGSPDNSAKVRIFYAIVGGAA